MTDGQHSSSCSPFVSFHHSCGVRFVCAGEQKYKRPRKANLRHSTMHLTNYAVNKASKVGLRPPTRI